MVILLLWNFLDVVESQNYIYVVDSHIDTPLIQEVSLLQDTYQKRKSTTLASFVHYLAEIAPEPYKTIYYGLMHPLIKPIVKGGGYSPPLIISILVNFLMLRLTILFSLKISI